MLRIRIIPILLWANGGLVKSLQFRRDRYIGDPINTIRIFNEKCADEIALLDVTATIEKKEPNYALVEECASECFMPLAYGGGISSVDHIAKLFSLGVEKVIINTAAYENLNWISEAVQQFGGQSIVISVDVNKQLFGGYFAVVNRGRRRAPCDLVEHIHRCQDVGIGEIIVTAVHTDGVMKGYDLELIRFLSPHIRVPFVVSGGAGVFAHFESAIAAGADAVAGGSFFVFHGKHRAVLVTYPAEHEMVSLTMSFPYGLISK